MISKSYTGRIIWGTVTKYKEMCWSLLWQNLSHYIVRSVENLLTQHLRNTAQKLKFSIKDFFSKCYKIHDQIRPKTIISYGNSFFLMKPLFCDHWDLKNFVCSISTWNLIDKCSSVILANQCSWSFGSLNNLNHFTTLN